MLSVAERTSPAFVARIATGPRWVSVSVALPSAPAVALVPPACTVASLAGSSLLTGRKSGGLYVVAERLTVTVTGLPGAAVRGTPLRFSSPLGSESLIAATTSESAGWRSNPQMPDGAA